MSRERPNADDTSEDGPHDFIEVTPWNSLQFFLELAQKGTLVRASRRLGVSHTTVLRQIAKLERTLDTKLFERDSTGFRLTGAGHDLFERADGMAQMADEIFRPRRAPDTPAGPVRIAALEGLAMRVLTPAFARFSHLYPQIEIELVTTMHPVNITLKEADIAVGPTCPKGRRISTKHLASCPIHLFAAPRYLAEHGCPHSLQDLNDHFFVDYVDDLVELPELSWFRDTVGIRNVVFRSNSPLVQLEAVRNGIGIGMFPDYLVGTSTQFDRLLPTLVNAERAYWLAMHSDLWRVPRMRITAQFLTATLAERFKAKP